MKLTTILWRDIPSQVIVRAGRNKAKQQLSHRFQAAIDRAAMRAGKGGSDAYLEEWQRQTTQLEPSDDIDAAAAACAAELEAQFSDEDLEDLIRNKGV
ncbi:MAG: virulence factor, partial [Pseudomonadales bacterium]